MLCGMKPKASHRANPTCLTGRGGGSGDVGAAHAAGSSRVMSGGAAVGLMFGTILGVVMDNVGLGIAMGLPLSFAFGHAFGIGWKP